MLTSGENQQTGWQDYQSRQRLHFDLIFNILAVLPVFPHANYDIYVFF